MNYNGYWWILFTQWFRMIDMVNYWACFTLTLIDRSVAIPPSVFSWLKRFWMLLKHMFLRNKIRQDKEILGSKFWSLAVHWKSVPKCLLGKQYALIKIFSAILIVDHIPIDVSHELVNTATGSQAQRRPSTCGFLCHLPMAKWGTNKSVCIPTPCRRPLDSW